MPEYAQIPSQRAAINEYRSFSDLSRQDGLPIFMSREWYRFFDLLHTNTPTPGTYTPTLTPVLNVSALTAAGCFYTLSGGTAQVSGTFTLQPVAAGTTVMYMTLPSPSNFTSLGQAAGTFVTTATGFSDGGAVIANVTTQQFEFRFEAVNTGSAVYVFTLNYQIV